MLNHKQSGGPMFTFSLPGGGSHTCTSVSYTTVVDLRCMLSLYRNRIFGFQGIRSCKTAFVIRMYLTPQGVPEFSRGVPTWWGAQGCSICVLFKNSHKVSNIMFFAQAQCVNFSQVLKLYLWESMNRLYFPSCLFVMLFRWPSLDYESLFLSSVHLPFFRTVEDRVENRRSESLECRTLHSFISAQIRSCKFWRCIAMHCSLWNTRSCSGPQPGGGQLPPPRSFQKRFESTKTFLVVK